MTHADINAIPDLKGHKILIASSSYMTFWPWLKQRFGFTDDMAGAYTFNLQPFLVDKTLAVQAYATSEPFEARKQEPDVKFFLFAKEGYPPVRQHHGDHERVRQQEQGRRLPRS